MGLLSATINDRFYISLVFEEGNNETQNMTIGNYTIESPNHEIVFLQSPIIKDALRTYKLTVYPMNIGDEFTLTYNDGETSFSETLVFSGGSYANQLAVFPVYPVYGSTDNSPGTPICFDIVAADVSISTIDYTVSLLFNSFEIEILTETPIGEYIVRYTKENALRYDSTYWGRILVEIGEDNTLSTTWNFATISGKVSEKAFKYTYTDKTQQLANYYPAEGRIRKLRYSVGQMFFNPIALKINEIDRFLDTYLESLYPQTANLKQTGCLSKVRIPSFPFVYSNRNGRNEYIIPTVLGYEDTHRFVLETTTDNDLFSIESLTPSHFTGEVALDQDLIFGENSLSVNSKNEFSYHFLSPRELFFLVKDVEGFALKDRYEEIRFPSIVIKGISEREIEEQEEIPLFYNGIYMSKIKYRYIKEIYFQNIEGLLNGEFYVADNPYSLAEAVSPLWPTIKGLPTSDITKRYWWSLVESVGPDRGSLLNQKILIANNLDDFLAGDLGLETYRGYELFDVDETTPLNLLAIHEKPFENIMVGIGKPSAVTSDDGDNHLYLFPTEEEWPDKTLLDLMKYDDPNFTIGLEILDFSKTLNENGERTLHIAIISNGALNTPLKTRVSVSSVNESGEIETTYLDFEGNATTANGAWVPNISYGAGFKKYEYDYIISDLKDYLFRVESYSKNKTSSFSSYLVRSLKKTAFASYRLDFLQDIPVGFWFDNNQTICVLTNNGSIWKLEEIRNAAVIDFKTKEIFSINPKLTAMEPTYEL